MPDFKALCSQDITKIDKNLQQLKHAILQLNLTAVAYRFLTINILV